MKARGALVIGLAVFILGAAVAMAIQTRLNPTGDSSLKKNCHQQD